MMLNYNHLLDEYRSLWKGRNLVSKEGAEYILKEAIARELKDENSHPRVRKPIFEKYFLATKRVIESDLTEESKLALILLHLEQVEQMK